jgi:predicted nucleic acid-binding protein
VIDDSGKKTEQPDAALDTGLNRRIRATIQLVCECRDPKDDKFLEVALNGRAEVVITGDEYLLAMNPWRDIAIQLPAQYLKR